MCKGIAHQQQSSANAQLFGHVLLHAHELSVVTEGSVLSATLELGVLVRAAVSFGALLEVCDESLPHNPTL